MMNSETRERATWKTIDYVGGGYVLQVKQSVTVKLNKSRRTVRPTVDDVSPEYNVDVDTYGEDRQGPPSVGNVSVEQPHRLVHITELAGVDETKFLQDATERGLGE